MARLKKHKRIQRAKFTIALIAIFVLAISLGVNVYSVTNFFSSGVGPEDIKEIYIKQSVIDQLNDRFMVDDNQEFLFCLYDSPFRGSYIIESAEEPPVQKSTSCEVVYQRCPIKTNYLGTIHAHRNDFCFLSSEDKKTFSGSDDTIAGIICGVDKFNVFTQFDMESPIVVMVRT